MKVWVLQYYDAHDTWTQGVYVDKHIAEEYHQRNPEWSEGYAGHCISEYELVSGVTCLKDFGEG